MGDLHAEAIVPPAQYLLRPMLVGEEVLRLRAPSCPELLRDGGGPACEHFSLCDAHGVVPDVLNEVVRAKHRLRPHSNQPSCWPSARFWSGSFPGAASR